MFSPRTRGSVVCFALLLAGWLAASAHAQVVVPGPTTESVVVMPPTSAPSDSSGSDWLHSDRAVLTPNMYGDIPGNRPLAVRVLVPGAPIVTSRQISGFLRAPIIGGPIANANFRANMAPQLPSPILTEFYTPPLSYLGQQVTPVTTFTATSTITNTAPFPAIVPLLDNPIITGNVQALFAAPGETAVFNDASRAIQVVRNIYDIFLVYDLLRQTPGAPVNLELAMANPADGALVGRTKISTDNNPLPRDRVIFNYDYLDHTPLKPGGQDINRICVGFEKAFFDGLGSLEIRLPFASTVNGVADQGVLDGSHTELGNLYLTLKALAFSEEMLSVSGGLGISLPTASDTRLHIGGTDLAQIRNETVLLTPFIAFLFTPSDNLFGQAWFQVGFDTCGNPVRLNLNNTGLQRVGRLHDPHRFMMDYQVGYWLIHPASSTTDLRGLAPFFEVHYNTTISEPGSVSAGTISVVDALNSYDEFSLSAGVTAQVWDNLFLTTGVTVPMLQGNNRFGDWQVGFRLSWFFGGTAEARSAAISNF